MEWIRHSTFLFNLPSILEKGLIPAGSENYAQYWESEYHRDGVYFSIEEKSNDILEIMNTGYYLGDGKFDNAMKDYSAINIYLQLDLMKEDLAIDCDIISKEEFYSRKWTQEEIISHGSIVILREIKPEEIKEIHVINNKDQREIIKDMGIEDDRIKFIDLY